MFPNVAWGPPPVPRVPKPLQLRMVGAQVTADGLGLKNDIR